MKRLLALLLLLLLTLSIVGQSKLSGTAKVSGTVKVTVSAGGGGGGSDFVTDSFTEGGTGVISLNSHVGELGATWTQHPHANYASGALDLDADGDQVFGNGTEASYASGTPPSADYYVKADFCVKTVIAQSIGIAGRMSTTDDLMYLGRLVDGATWQLRATTASGSFITLGSSTSNVPTAGGACVEGKVIMTGNQISFSIANGATVIGPFTDGNVTAAGRAGIRNNGTGSATTGTHLDNFSAR